MTLAIHNANASRKLLGWEPDKARLRTLRKMSQELPFEPLISRMAKSEQDLVYVARLLSYNDRIVKNFAAHAFMKAAEQPCIDISIAIPALGETLMTADSPAKDWSAKALGKSLNRVKYKKEAMRELISGISKGDADTRRYVALALMDAAEASADISPAFPALGNALFDESFEVRRLAARALAKVRNLAREVDLAASPGLISALSDRNAEIAGTAAYILSEAAEKTGIGQAIPALALALSHKDAEVRKHCLRAFRSAVEKGTDISKAITKIGKRLVHDKDPDARHIAAEILEKAAVNGYDLFSVIPALVRGITDKVESVGTQSVLALLRASRNAQERVRHRMVGQISGLVNSDWMSQQSERNQDAYIAAMHGISVVLGVIKEKERAA